MTAALKYLDLITVVYNKLSQRDVVQYLDFYGAKSLWGMDSALIIRGVVCGG